MGMSLLWVEKDTMLEAADNKKGNGLLRLKKLLEQYFPQANLDTSAVDKFKNLDLKKHHYELILTHEKNIVKWANLEGVDAILWEKLSDLGAKLDVFLQLRRYLEQYPLKLHGWSLREVVHNGRDAVVFKAIDESGNTYAIKRFKYILDNLPIASIQDFLASVETQCGLQSKGLVEIYEGGVSDHAFYLVMEYMDHGTLGQSLKNCGVLPLPHALIWFKEIALALACVHQAGLIHRDLKADNIMMRDDGSLALSDYGISKSILLQTGFISEEEINCSPYYVSPEQVSGELCTQASDIYSLGIIFYELLTGKKPFECSNSFELMMHHVMAPIPVLPENLKQFQSTLDGMLTKDSHKRFSTPSVVLEQLPQIELKLV